MKKFAIFTLVLAVLTPQISTFPCTYVPSVLNWIGKVFPMLPGWYPKWFLWDLTKFFGRSGIWQRVLTAFLLRIPTFPSQFNRKEFPVSGNVTRIPVARLRNYANRYTGFSTGESAEPKHRNTCWKLKVFHILHRFFHRSFPQEYAVGSIQDWFT